MHFFKEYIINILGVILISSLCETFLPEGNMKKYSASIIGLSIIGVLVLPLTSLDEININVEKTFSATVDDTQYNKMIAKEYSERIEKHINERSEGRVVATVILSEDMLDIERVKLSGNPDTALISYIINDLGVSRYDIEIRRE